MTHQNNYNFSSELAEQGLDAIPELLRVTSGGASSGTSPSAKTGLTKPKSSVNTTRIAKAAFRKRRVRWNMVTPISNKNDIRFLFIYCRMGRCPIQAQDIS